MYVSIYDFLFQVSIKSVQACNITFPFNIYVKEIEFDVDGVATIAYENSVAGNINCSPNKVC